VSQDLRPAAEISVRSLRWTKEWLDKPNLSEADYNFLAMNEVQAYSSLYFRTGRCQSVFLVAKVDEEDTGSEGGSASEAAWPMSLLGMGGSSGPRTRTRVVGCVGCEVKCFRQPTGEEVAISNYVDGDSTVLRRPVMADLAVDSAYRGQGIARKLVAKLEEVVQDWGYEEVTLLVEATNFQARGLYERLGYRLNGFRLSTPTSYLETGDGPSRLAERQTAAFLLRRSLLPFPVGAIENTNWGLYAAALAAALAAVDALRSGGLQLPQGLVEGLPVVGVS